MKADLSRDTFRKPKHYSSVRMQQGRVQVDADWNEQLDIIGHRSDTETVDVIGRCGAPLAAAGFHLVAAVADLSAEEQARADNQNAPALAGAGDFYISGGRLYVDGTLCENEQIVPYSAQPHLPAAPMVDSDGIYLAYLDVWQRHITALEDDEIREKALNGVDTATRTQTLWQVRWLRAADLGAAVNCLTPLPAYDSATAAGTGTLAARAQPGGASSDPCIVPTSAGYRRLENQLYRVEVHDAGDLGVATFKWSRENGTVVAHWLSQNGDQITVSSAGRDAVLGFTSGDWVELLDSERELLALPGTLVRLLSVSDNVLTLDTATATGSIDLANFQSQPKVRRWESAGALQPGNSDWLDLEDGVQIQLSTGSYRSGDYWLIPARTNTGEVEWPLDPVSGNPAARAPAGIQHHYCRLAVMTFDGGSWTRIDDCRPLFAPLTQMQQLFYVSGDGQEALPGAELDKDLQVGVAIGRHPVAGARVRFTRIDGDGALLPRAALEESGSATERIVITGSDGIASCGWQLGAPTGPRTHCVEAVLLDVADNTRHLPIRFNASLSLAAHVYYDPGQCATLAGATTVQSAVDTLARQAAISAWRGDDQRAAPGTPLPEPLLVVVSNACGPVAGAEVVFQPQANGAVAATAADLPGATPGTAITVTTDSNGVATVFWQLDSNLALPCQQLRAELASAGGFAIRQPSQVYFNGCHYQQQQNCFIFLDELRANGVTAPSPRGPLGLEVSVDPGNPTGIVYTAGIAYVAGCRFEIAAGALPVPGGSSPEQLVVDNSGQVQFLRKGNEPPDWALLADIYVALDDSRITRIIDRRTDLTHLDRRVDAIAADLAKCPPDRRATLPVLADSLPHLRYQRGHNAIIPVSDGNRQISGLAFDGEAVWMAVFGSDVAYRIPANNPSAEALESIELSGDPAFDVCYDGGSHMWFTTFTRDTVVSVDTRTRERHTYDIPGTPFFAIATAGDRVWITSFSSNNLNVIDPGRGEILATIAVLDPTSGEPLIPYVGAYDGVYVWLGCGTSGGQPRLLRVPGWELSPRFEDVSTGLDSGGLIAGLTFDGARLWVHQMSQILIKDVAIDDGRMDEIISTNDPRWPGRPGYFYKGLCDGRRVWLASLARDDLDTAVSSHGARFGELQGRLTLVRNDPRPNYLSAMTFDGMHMWFAGFGEEGPQLWRYLAAGD